MDYSKLKALAEKATPGPWQVGYNDKSGQFRESDGYCIVQSGSENTAILHTDEVFSTEADANFIAAANPETILDLLAEIEELRGLIFELEQGEDL